MKRTPPPDRSPQVRLTPDERAYFEAVEAHFIRLRGRPLILSPRELERAAGWHREGIPLRVVCRGIDDYFDKRFKRSSSRQRAVSLEYCEEFVRRAYEQSRQLAVGIEPEGEAAEEGGGRELEQALQRLSQRLQQALSEQSPPDAGLMEALHRAHSAVSAMMDSAGCPAHSGQVLTVQAAEAELEQLDRQVTDELLRTAGPQALEEIRESCDAEMRESAASMDPALYQSTLTRMTLRRLRQLSRIPEISLFTL